MGDIIKFRVSLAYRGDGKMPNIKEERKKLIEERAKELVADIDFEKSPYVDIVSIVKKDGFEVTPKEMDIDTTGCIFVNDDEKEKERIIIVNKNFKDPDNEEDVIFKKSRFITAHEYGHFILHKKDGEPMYAHRDTDHRTEEIEQEADYFARCILMPEEQFRLYYQVLNKFGNDDKKFTIDILSKLFSVTRNKVNLRVEDILV